MPDDSPVPRAPGQSLAPRDPGSPVARLQQRTPARLLVGRAGTGYRTATQLSLRQDHAAAMDAVRREIDPAVDFGQDFVSRHPLVCVSSSATSKSEYLLRPDLGRVLSAVSRVATQQQCKANADLQFVIGDGLSVAAVCRQVPVLLPLLEAAAAAEGWTIGNTVFVRYARVGIMNDLGELLTPKVIVLLIGERPGLATDESLSTYMAYRPRAGHSDADRNLISNIHDAGVPAALAAPRIMALAKQMMAAQTSGTAVKEKLPELTLGPQSWRLGLE
jgi:ethanolamine ammonia-lyase small subunit